MRFISYSPALLAGWTAPFGEWNWDAKTVFGDRSSPNEQTSQEGLTKTLAPGQTLSLLQWKEAASALDTAQKSLTNFLVSRQGINLSAYDLSRF
jgi:hypothetical protein